MFVKEVIQSQYLASLAMLGEVVSQCPDDLWLAPGFRNQFWHIAYHTLFYTHLYLQVSEKDFTPWNQHRKEYQFLDPLPWPPHKEPDIGEPYSMEAILEYLGFCRNEVKHQVASLDLDAVSGFHWLPFSKLELQFYNIRHIQHHAGQLIDRLRNHEGIGIGWVGMKSEFQI